MSICAITGSVVVSDDKLGDLRERTIAFLPDPQAYLDDLLRTRERLAATIDGVDEWAAPTPPPEEITRTRRLINRIKGDIADLDETERA